jgi:ADP-dependent NAD(P)H-hydrate dehydratase / NAD(P)H-hydrate epimerase
LIKVVSVEQMRQIEAAADAASMSYDQMMQAAGRAAADRVLELIADRQDARVTVLVGPGNNGGDGLVAGRIVAQESVAQVRFYLLKAREDSDANFIAVKEAGLLIANAQDDRDKRVLRNMVASADVVVDALFGIGVQLPIKDEAAKVLRNVRQALDGQEDLPPRRALITLASPDDSRPATKPYVVAVDCPSGLDCDTGELDKNAIPADETITFIAAKPGLFIFPGAEAVGQLSVAPIEIPEDLEPLQNEKRIVVDGDSVRDLLPARPANANKGTFGKALVVAGSVNFVGASGLSAQAAYRVGTGLVTVGAPHPVVALLAAQFLEPTWLLLPHDMGVLSENAAELIQEEVGEYNALLLGPGWGRENTTRGLLTRLFEKPAAPSKRIARRKIGFMFDSTATADGEVTETNLPPLVIDADGLNLLSEIENWWTLLPARTVLTPHPGEMARLAGITTEEVQAKRWEIAARKAVDWNAVVVLKGAHTVIAEPDGRVAILPFKTDALATAGTGDILAGAITGLLAQGLSPFEAALVGGYIHGLAGQQAAEWLGSTRAVIAGDVLDSLTEAIALLG